MLSSAGARCCQTSAAFLSVIRRRVNGASGGRQRRVRHHGGASTPSTHMQQLFKRQEPFSRGPFARPSRHEASTMQPWRMRFQRNQVSICQHVAERKHFPEVTHHVRLPACDCRFVSHGRCRLTARGDRAASGRRAGRGEACGFGASPASWQRCADVKKGTFLFRPRAAIW